jgi:hypothetical protein
MPVAIPCLPAMLMVNHDRLIRTIRIFADNPAVLRTVGEEFNIPHHFSYDCEAPSPTRLSLPSC